MAVKDAKNHLKEMVKVLNDKFARGQVDDFRQIVTLEFDNIVMAWKEGYSTFVAAEKHKNADFPNINTIDFEGGVRSAWTSIEASIKENKGHIRESTSEYIVFNEDKMTKDIYDAIKKHLVTFVQNLLGDYKLTDAKAEVDSGRASNYFVGASKSDIGLLKKGTHRLHKNNTTVGSARLAMTMKWMSKTRFFKGFLASKEAKTIQDKYGDLLATWDTKGTKKRGLKVTPKEDIKISVGAGKTNKAGDEPEDFGEIYKVLEPLVLAWAKNAEIAGRKGSKSIEENAVDIAEHVAVVNLTKSPKVKARRKTKGSSRGASKAESVATSKNKRTSKKAKAKLIQRKQAATRKSASMQPLQLIGLINKELPNTVRKNMQSPALVNRTGRFAESVRLTDVVQTPKGYPSFGYTYQRNPYQVFEDGSSGNWSNGERDPRELIDKSIREIAAQFAIGRFYTRRQ